LNLASAGIETPFKGKDKPVTARKAENSPDNKLQIDLAVESEIDNLVRKDFGARRQPASGPPNELNADGLSSLISRVAGHSAKEIDSLIAELHHVQGFLRAEGERVQRKINEYAQMNQSALASIKIIADAIGPWKSAALDRQPAATETE
jgi:hypothetical protein